MANFIGNKPNQVPTNGDLGTLAFQDASNPNLGAVVAEGLTVDTTTLVVDAVNNRVGIGTASPNQKLSVAGIIQSESSGNGIQIQQSAQDGYINMTGTGFISFRNGASYTDRMKLDSSGNLGIGVTPSAWSTGKSIEVGSLGNAVYGYATANINVLSGAYFNSGFKYAGSGTAVSYYGQAAGIHAWYTAPSGTAGNAITFTQAMTLNASGNLGIGTSSPATKLEVYNATNADQYWRTSAVSLYAQANNTNASGIFGTLTNHPLVLWTNSAERMRIDSAGNVGIGVTSPAFPLEIGGSSATAGRLRFSTTTNTAGFDIGWLGGVAVANAYIWNRQNGAILFGSDNIERMRIDSAGNVGIGTASPTSKLVVNQTSSSQGAIYALAASAQNGNAFLFGITGVTNGYAITNDGSNNIVHYWAGTGGAERMRIDTSGNVGIGTASPADKLEVVNTGTANTYAVVKNGTITTYAGVTGSSYGLVGTASNHSFVLSTNATERMRIDSSGVVELSQGQIKFPATQVASANANTLDDYEEGTFTPTAAGTTTAGTGTYTYQIGRYTKIGNRVFFSISLAWTAHTGTGNINILGLPFTVLNATNSNAPVALYSDAYALTAGYIMQGFATVNTTTVTLRQIPTGGGAATTITLDTAVTALLIEGHYETA